MAMLNRLPLRMLIACMSALSVFTLIIVGLVFSAANSRMSAAIHDASVLIQIENQLNDAAGRASTSALTERDFLATPKDDSARAALGANAAARECLHAVEKAAGANPALASLIETGRAARIALEKTGEDMARVIDRQRRLGFNENDGLVGALRAGAHGAETGLRGIEDKSLLVMLLTLRRNEKDFMLRHDQRYVEQFRETHRQLTQALPQSQLPQQVAQRAGESHQSRALGHE